MNWIHCCTSTKDGFKEEFLKNDYWYAIRIFSAMIDRIRYIVVYPVAPVFGITYIAEIDRIEKDKDTNKYIVYFKYGTTEKINKVALGKHKRLSPQGLRYSSRRAIPSV